MAITKEITDNNNATVIVCFRSKERAEELAKEISGNAFGIGLEVTSGSNVQKLVNEVMTNRLRIDFLFNNAGYPFDNQIRLRGFMR